MDSQPQEQVKEIVGKDLGPELHISLETTDQGFVRVEAKYSGKDGRGGVWFEESPQAALDRLIAFLPANFQSMGKAAESLLLGSMPKP